MSDGVSIDYYGQEITNHNTAEMCTEETCSSREARFHMLNACGMSMHVVLCDKHSLQLENRSQYREHGTLEYRLDEKDGVYLVPCRLVDDQYVYWCDWCCREHRHGAGAGNRVAHCHDNSSPYSKGIYVYEGTADDPPHKNPLGGT